LTAASAEEGLKTASGRPAGMDPLLTDVVMRGMTGISLLLPSSRWPPCVARDSSTLRSAATRCSIAQRGNSSEAAPESTRRLIFQQSRLVSSTFELRDQPSGFAKAGANRSEIQYDPTITAPSAANSLANARVPAARVDSLERDPTLGVATGNTEIH
jgi:hypothetical protein